MFGIVLLNWDVGELDVCYVGRYDVIETPIPANTCNLPILQKTKNKIKKEIKSKSSQIWQIQKNQK